MKITEHFRKFIKKNDKIKLNNGNTILISWEDYNNPSFMKYLGMEK